ncbi:MAG: hypothetical protein D6725_05605 [Planctomycetota bacterium]|nr:MAG: hypothetical protein D6725_05605 [Planctomycetota bacterium]
MCLGCGGGSDSANVETVPVQGTVTLDGKPLEGATVTFVPVNEGQGLPATGTTDEEGRFTLTAMGGGKRGAPGAGTLPGEYYVGVVKDIVEGDEAEDSPPEGQFPEASDQPTPEPKTTHVVPTKYNDPKSSGIKVTVKEGDNDIKIELKSD